MQIMTRRLFFILFAWAYWGAASAQIDTSQIGEIPPQFLSTNAAEILGLDPKGAPSTAVIKKAQRQLLKKYHPDKGATHGSGRFSKEQLDFISAKINTAAKILLQFLQAKTQTHGKSPHGKPDAPPTPSGPEPWTHTGPWTSPTKHPSIWGAGRGESLRGTIFQGLPEGANTVHFLLKASSGLGLAAESHLLLILRPKDFPFIEGRLLAIRDFGNGSNNLIAFDNIRLQYRRNHHQGGSGRGFDAILVDPRSDGGREPYILPMSLFSFSIRPLHGSPPGTYLATPGMNSLFTSFPDRFSFGDGHGYTLMEGDEAEQLIRETLMPHASELAWYQVNLPAGETPILLRQMSDEPAARSGCADALGQE